MVYNLNKFKIKTMKNKIENVAILIMDMQHSFLGYLSNTETKRIIEGQKELLLLAKKEKIPVLVFEYYAYGNTDEQIRLSLKGCFFKTFTKKYDSAFSVKKLDPWLRKRGIKNLILAGIFADACVLSTAVNALNKGYKIITCGDLIANNSIYCREEVKMIKAERHWYEDEGLLLETVEDLRDNFSLRPNRNLYHYFDRIKFAFV